MRERDRWRLSHRYSLREPRRHSQSWGALGLQYARAATETVTSLWGALIANATLTVHAAGWLEGGLSFGYEKFK
jgi:trimethylamine:corrinoid methyltransferase-like protein